MAKANGNNIDLQAREGLWAGHDRRGSIHGG